MHLQMFVFFFFASIKKIYLAFVKKIVYQGNFTICYFFPYHNTHFISSTLECANWPFRISNLGYRHEMHLFLVERYCNLSMNCHFIKFHAFLKFFFGIFSVLLFLWRSEMQVQRYCKKLFCKFSYPCQFLLNMNMSCY